MNRFSSLVRFAPLLLAGICVGCGESISLPPVTSESVLSPDDTLDSRTSVPTIALVIPQGTDLDSAAWEQTFRILAADRKVLVEVTYSPQGAQNETIRDLLTRGVSVAVIVPDPATAAADIKSALDSIAEQKLPVLFLHRGVEGLDPSPPVVKFSPIESDAQALVAAAVEDARSLGFPDDAEAVILTNGPFDEAGRARLAALQTALAATSHKVLPNIEFQGYGDAIRPLFEKVVHEHENLGIVLAEEGQGTLAAASNRDAVLKDTPDRKPYLVAGFGHTKDLLGMSDRNQFAALAVRDPEKIARRAFDLALAIARGQNDTVGDVVIPSEIRRATGPPERSLYEPVLPSQADSEGDPSLPPALRNRSIRD